ncbi:19535_t:CDS:2 [Racocetra fulgida]|uniref:19535_t:CDS:1 n=1 Tax=Racocetra fulgida TaxID=60492 RepID=A0A9N8WM88_9GLOM|nr:19535_t:CDS:2 [Racocetra fulgida]
MSVNEYEAQRLSNIEANKEVLRELGLERPPPIFIAKRKKATSDKRKVSRRFNESQNNTASSSDSNGRLRRSGRLSEKPQKNLSEDMLFMGIEGEPWRKTTVRKATVRKIAVYESDPNWRQNRPDPHQFGNIPGHEDDVDWGMHISQKDVKTLISSILEHIYYICKIGEAFTYTGSGGRDLKGTKNNPKNLRTAPQDQELVAGNLALKISCETKRPIRVIR